MRKMKRNYNKQQKRKFLKKIKKIKLKLTNFDSNFRKKGNKEKSVKKSKSNKRLKI